MTKYLLLIVEAEEAYATAGEAVLNEVKQADNAYAAESVGFGASLLGGEALQPMPTATYLRKTRTADMHTGRRRGRCRLIVTDAVWPTPC